MVLQLIMVDKNLRSATGLSLSLFRWDTTEPSGVCSRNPARLVIWSGRPTTLLQLLTHTYCTVYKLGLPSTYNKVGQSNCCASVHVTYQSVWLSVYYLLYVPRIYCLYPCIHYVIFRYFISPVAWEIISSSGKMDLSFHFWSCPRQIIKFNSI